MNSWGVSSRMDRRTTVATIDNHPVVREGIALHLERSAPDLALVASEATVEGYLSGAARAQVVLLDLLPDGGESTGSIARLARTGARVLIYTTEERPVPLRRAVECGATGVLLKNDPLPAVVDAVRRAAHGEFCCSGALAHALLTDESVVADLSERQVQVLQCLDEGLDYRTTSRVLGVSEGVIKTHLARIREKYRRMGIEPGNSHHLTRVAHAQGYLN